MADDDTPTKGIAALAGYEPGFKDGYRIGKGRVLECFRLAMIESGTEAGEAFVMAEKLGRWIEANGG